MAKFSSRKDAILMVKMAGTSDAVLYLIEEQAKNAEAEILGCNADDPKLRDKLVKSQTLRHILSLLQQDLK